MSIYRRIHAIGALALTVMLAQPDCAKAAEIKVWTARALATVLAEVGPQFEQATGHKLTVTAGLPDQFVQRAEAGESFDILITGSPPLDALIKNHKIIAATRTDIVPEGMNSRR
jgi:molybdate transport system substrate-binding protein